MQSSFASAGRTIRVDMHEPTTASPHAAVILLHGAGGNVGFWLDRLSPPLNFLGIALYAPHYFDSTGTIRADLASISDGVHVPRWLSAVDDALTFAAARPNVDPARVAVIGISLGAFLSLALAAQFSSSADAHTRGRIRTLVDLSGGLIDPFTAQATSQFPPTLILHGEADSVVPVANARSLDHLLTALNVPHETHILPREDHWFSDAANVQFLLAVASFLSQHL